MKVQNITVTDGRAKSSIETGVTNLISEKVTNQINQAIEDERVRTGVVTKFYPWIDKAEVKFDKTNKKVLCRILHRHGGELLDFYTPFGEETLCDKLKEPCVIPRDTLHCLVMNINDFDSEEHLILGFYMNEEIVGIDPPKPGNMKLITRGGSNHHWLSFGYCGFDVRTSTEPTREIGLQTDEVIPINYVSSDDVYHREESYSKEEVDGIVEDIIRGDIDLTGYIKKSDVEGLIKNDGTIDTNTYLTNQDITGKVDKIAGKGLSSNDFTDALKSKLENDVIYTGDNSTIVLSNGVFSVKSNVFAAKNHSHSGYASTNHGHEITDINFQSTQGHPILQDDGYYIYALNDFLIYDPDTDAIYYKDFSDSSSEIAIKQDIPNLSWEIISSNSSFPEKYTLYVNHALHLAELVVQYKPSTAISGTTQTGINVGNYAPLGISIRRSNKTGIDIGVATTGDVYVYGAVSANTNVQCSIMWHY